MSVPEIRFEDRGEVINPYVSYCYVKHSPALSWDIVVGVNTWSKSS